MTITTIYLARHGYRSNWLPPPHPPCPTGIDSDPPLAAHGVEQAKELATYLKSLPAQEQPQFIISSPFYRCIETSRPIAESLHLKVAIDRGVGEWFRKNRDTKPVPADYAQLNEFFNDVLIEEQQWPRDNLNVIPLAEGENETDILERAKLFWKAFIPKFQEKFPEVERILIISHAATKIALGSVLLELKSVVDVIDENETYLRAGSCSLSKFVRTNNDKWSIVMNGNCDFLSKGEEMNWDFRRGVEAGSAEDIAQRKAIEESLANQTTEESEIEVDDDDFEVHVPSNIKVDHDDDVSSNSDQAPKIRNHIIKPSAQLQFSDLTDEHPLVKISNNVTLAEPSAAKGTKSRQVQIDGSKLIDRRIFETSWKRLQGTELVFDENGKFIGKLKEHLVCDNDTKFAVKKRNNNGAAAEDGIAEPDQQGSQASQFLRKAIHAAKQKAAES
ncbi:TFC7 Transcription factor tau 55 kDa subunit [Candida maltosa Xu316]